MEYKSDKDINVETDDELLKQKSREYGLSYNEAIDYIAKTTGGRDTHIYSDTNPEEVKRKNMQ